MFLLTIMNVDSSQNSSMDETNLDQESQVTKDDPKNIFLPILISTNRSSEEENITSLFEFPITDVYRVLHETYQMSYLRPTAQVILITIYSLLIMFGIVGNAMVACVIGHKIEFRTPKNFYILNLILSDVSMCLVCMPFTLVGLLQKSWTLGSFICKLVPIIQCTNILVSTATIVAIAGDRYFTIVCGHRHRHTSKYYVLWSLVFIWLVSLAFSVPLFASYVLDRVFIRNIFLFDRCIESWSSPIIKIAWTITLLLIQYVIPIVVLSFVHANIKRFLNRNRRSQRDSRRTNKEIERNRRTTIVLSSVALVFAISWLPWHVVNFLADFHYSGFKEPEYFYMVFGACHVIAMSTACTNPILYGWLNTNLKKELSNILSRSFKKLRCCNSCKKPATCSLETSSSLVDQPHSSARCQKECTRTSIEAVSCTISGKIPSLKPSSTVASVSGDKCSLQLESGCQQHQELSGESCIQKGTNGFLYKDTKIFIVSNPPFLRTHSKSYEELHRPGRCGTNLLRIDSISDSHLMQ